MTTHVNMSSARPSLTPLRTSDKKHGHVPRTAFRTAQGPLLSPSPLSANSISNPMYSTSHGCVNRKKDQSLAECLSHQISPLSSTSPRPFVPIEGQSPLVSKLEEVSLSLTDEGKRKLSKSSLTDHGCPMINRTQQPENDGGNMEIADAYVIARSIRRKDKASDAASQSSTSRKDSGDSSTPRRLTIRAIIRPKSPARQTFLIQRSLNIGEGRMTAPASNIEKSSQSANSSKMSRKPLPVPAKWSSSNGRPSAGSRPLPELPSKPLSHSTDPRYEMLIKDPKAVPIHPRYAVSALPGLAALLMSGHVRTGDIIYLPVPHAESWPQTVRYAYTGQGELTAAVRENIAYLGGKV